VTFPSVRIGPWPIAVLFVMTLSSCDQRKEGAVRQKASVVEQSLAASAPPVIGAANGRTRDVAQRGANQTRIATTPAQPPAMPSMIIRTGDVAIQVDSLELAIAAVRQLAASLGGYIGNVNVNVGEMQVRSAGMEMKIPATRFDEAMAGMTPLGKVERSAATAEDVGEQFVDISARVANAKRLEQRLVTLLATRTGKLEDVLAVERELARVREEIERYEGRIRYLGTRVATSTILVTVHEKAPLVASQPGTNIIGEAFVAMWRNFVRFVAGGIVSLGVIIPVLALAWVAWRVTNRLRRVSPST
jgi:hypothetical protein